MLIGGGVQYIHPKVLKQKMRPDTEIHFVPKCVWMFCMQMHAHKHTQRCMWTVSSVWVDATSRHVWTVNICSGTFRMYYWKLMQLVDAQPLCGKHRKSTATTWRVHGSSPPSTLSPPPPSDHCCCGNCVLSKPTVVR